MLELHKLYQIKQYYFVLYPSKDQALDAQAIAEARNAVQGAMLTNSPDTVSYYWSTALNCNVSCLCPKTILFPVKVDGDYVKIVSTEGIGWIIVYNNWAMGFLEEVTE